MRELQLSLPCFKTVKRVCRRQTSSPFWTESILPECREVLRSVTLRPKGARYAFGTIYFIRYVGYADAIYSAFGGMLRKKSALRIFTSLLNFALGFVRVRGISHIADCPPQPLPQAGGTYQSAQTFLVFQICNSSGNPPIDI